MAFWWVNHKQTYNQEINGGYIWSPKNNINGATNQTYINLTKTARGDIVFSYANGEIKAIGVIDGMHREQPKPDEFGATGENWQKIGWAVPIQWEVLESPISPRERIEEIAPLLPTKHSPIQRNGNGNQSCYLASISIDLGKLLLDIATKTDPDVALRLNNDQRNIENDVLVKNILQQNIETTEMEQLIKARKGQGRFRLNVENIETKCRVTGVNMKSLLIASHIKPWKDSNNVERLDGNNGLLLSPHIDRLFDRGFISFTDEGSILFASKEILSILQKWGVDTDSNVGSFSPEQVKYLHYHRKEVFIK